MHIRVLGCSGSIAAGNRTTSFLLDDDVLIDAGTGVGDLSLQELAAIDHIFVTHSHLDHVLSIGLLADGVSRLRLAAARPPVQVRALPETLAAMRQHIFNGVIWPDFTRLPTTESPALALVPLQVGEVVTLGEREIEVLPARHTVPAVGYALRRRAPGPTSNWVYTGDTGPNPQLWERLARLQVSALVIETAFRDDERDVADISAHLCPSLLAGELSRFDAAADVFITHIKPGEVDAVMSEIAAQGGRHRVRALAVGQRMRVG